MQKRKRTTYVLEEIDEKLNQIKEKFIEKLLQFQQFLFITFVSGTIYSILQPLGVDAFLVNQMAYR